MHYDSEYHLEVDETPLLICEKCDQGVHTPCLAIQLNCSPEDLPFLTPSDVLAKINPLKINGFHYLCNYCADAYIPTGEEGKLKRTQTQPSQKPADPQQSQADEANTPPVDNSAPETPSLHDQERKVTKSLRKSGNPVDQTTQSHRDICPEYKKGTCQHGISGKGCSFFHPKPCSKYLRHGTTQDRGCNEGDACDRFHFPMCNSSLDRGECLNDKCKQMHVLGTRRKNTRKTCPAAKSDTGCSDTQCKLFHPRGKTRQKNGAKNTDPKRHRDPSPPASSEVTKQDAFLDQMSKLLISLDQKLHSLQPAHQQPSQQQTQPVQSLPPAPPVAPQPPALQPQMAPHQQPLQTQVHPWGVAAPTTAAGQTQSQPAPVSLIQLSQLLKGLAM